MKLPKHLDKYKHNAQIAKLYVLAHELTEPAEDGALLADICEHTMQVLKKINAIVIHLELAIDEIMKMENK